MGSALSALTAELAARGAVSDADVLALRRLVFGDAAVTPYEAEALIKLDESLAQAPSAWSELFVEALTDFIVHQQPPQGYVSDENAEWLTARLGADGRVKTATELELLIKVLEQATAAPPALAAFALAQVKHAVLTGEGPLARGGALMPGVISRAEVELLRRVLYAFGGSGNVAITLPEAEVLFALNDASACAANDPSWDELFVKALANFLLAASHYDVPPRAEALRRERWLDEPGAGVLGFFRRMAAGGPAEIFAAYARPDAEQAFAARNAEREAATRIAAQVTEREAQWLAERLGRDGAMTANERALLGFLQQEAASLHPLLRPLLDKAA